MKSTEVLGVGNKAKVNTESGVYEYCCSRDGHGLEYPGFSIAFIQTFVINHALKFHLDEKALAWENKDDYQLIYDTEGVGGDKKQGLRATGTPAEGEESRKIIGTRPKADYLEVPIAPWKSNIGTMIFDLPANPVEMDNERTVKMFSLRGFDFKMDINPEKDEFKPITVKCHVKVEMVLFFGNTVSMTYRLLFDGHSGTLSENAETDHIISILSTYLGAEFWSGAKEENRFDINFETAFSYQNLYFDSDGNPLSSPQKGSVKGTGRSFEDITLRYKKFIIDHCTVLNTKADKKEIRLYAASREGKAIDTFHDTRYAMVDVWEDIMHPLPDGSDFFATDREPRLSEAEVVSHIRQFHRPELIGLLTLYPGEWPYRDARAYDEICGEDISIDTDDLVIAGSSVCLVLGTYARRSSETGETKGVDVDKQGVDWVAVKEQRMTCGVSWAEYLLILQMVLAKKHVIGLVSDILTTSILDAKDDSEMDMLDDNAKRSMRMTRMIMQLDVVKYSRFPSHKVMFDRTTRRLGLENDMETLRQVMDTIDSSLHNISDYKSIESDFVLNIVLAVVSIISSFQLLFQPNDMPFLHHFGVKATGLASWTVLVVTAIAIFVTLWIITKFLKFIFSKKK